MFLVYDGGHSIHKSIWAASQVNPRLELGLDLGTTGELKDFVSDYENFQNIFTGELKSTVESTFEKATEYFEKYSYYSKPRDELI